MKYIAAGILFFALFIASPVHAASITVNTGQVYTLTADTTVVSVTVKSGGTLRFNPNASVTLTSTGNVIISGTLEMKPVTPTVVSTLRFSGINEANFVGGGLVPLSTDVGLWVVGAGKLDILGSAKTSWTRAAGSIPVGATTITLTTAPTGWRAGDTISVAPTRIATGSSLSWTQFDLRTITAISGAAVTLSSPTTYFHGTTTDPANGVIYTAEVLNLTRNVKIEGTGDGNATLSTNHRAHIFIKSSVPQSIRFVQLRYLGPRKVDGKYTTIILGRYGLHFHMSGDGSRGSIVEGVVARDIGSHTFVPHGSHGITLKDDISYNTFDDAYWWDAPVIGNDPGMDVNDTNDLLITHSVAAIVRSDPTFRGTRLAGFILRKGNDFSNSLINSVAVGVQGSADASGFSWPETGHSVWIFHGDLAHNNAADGIFVWQNDQLGHVITDYVGYNNTGAGIDHGAYGNGFVYNGLDLWGNYEADFKSRASARGITQPDGYDHEILHLHAGIFAIVEHTLSYNTPTLVKDSTVDTVTVDEFKRDVPGQYDFVNVVNPDGSPLGIDDFVIISAYPASTYRIQQPDGTAYVLDGDGIYTLTEPFYTVPLNTGLSAYYAMSNTNDSLGSNNLTNHSATFTSGKVANAATMASASSQYLSHADASAFEPGDGNFTVAVWVKLTSKPVGTMGLVSKWETTGNQRGWELTWNSTVDRFKFIMSNDGTNSATVQADTFGAPSIGTWYFIAARYNAATDTMSISVNGGAWDTVTASGGAYDGTGDIQFGRVTTSSYLNGQVDELGIWKHYFSTSQVASLYNSGSGRDYTYIASH